MAEELKKFGLSAIAIIGLIAVVLIGMAVTAGFSKELRTTTITNASTTTFTFLNNTPVSVGTTGQFPFLQDLESCGNDTDLTGLNLTPTNFYTVNEGGTDGGTVTLLQAGLIWNGTAVNCSRLTYLAGSSGQSAADKFTTGLGIFGTFSVIIILAIVGKAIISLFKKND